MAGISSSSLGNRTPQAGIPIQQPWQAPRQGITGYTSMGAGILGPTAPTPGTAAYANELGNYAYTGLLDEYGRPTAYNQSQRQQRGNLGTAPSGSGSGQGVTGSGSLPQPREPRMQAQPAVPPIDVNAIINQWKSIQSPQLPREAEIPHIDSTAAAQAAYGRAKDTAGQQGRAAMDALMDVQGGRGVVGSGLGVNEAGGIIGAVNQNLGDVTRERLIQDYETELARQTENAGLRVDQRGQDIDQQGLNQQLLSQLQGLYGLQQGSALQQRGQNIGIEQGNYQGGITQRGQDTDALTALARLRY